MKAKTRVKVKKTAKPSLKDLEEKTLKPKKKKGNFLKVLATTIGLIGVVSALLVKKENTRKKKSKSKSGAA